MPFQTARILPNYPLLRFFLILMALNLFYYNINFLILNYLTLFLNPPSLSPFQLVFGSLKLFFLVCRLKHLIFD